MASEGCFSFSFCSKHLWVNFNVGGGGCSCRWSGLSIPRISRVSGLRPLNTARLRMFCYYMFQCLHSEVYTCREDAYSLLQIPVLTIPPESVKLTMPPMSVIRTFRPVSPVLTIPAESVKQTIPPKSVISQQKREGEHLRRRKLVGV